MVVHRHVVVDVDLRLAPARQVIAVLWQRTQEAALLLEAAAAGAFEFLKPLCIELGKLIADELVEGAEAVECMVAQRCQDALDLAHTSLPSGHGYLLSG
ncbi:MAG: hypothetical protein OEQ18_15285 [Gammaproteobacteria bacterium]|nr:hypothetical protein [Gammaproteobacteria bacterium]